MCVDSHINLRVVFVVVTTFYTLVNMRSIYFFRVALVIVICRDLKKGWLHDDGEVKEVSIAGSTKFSTNDIFDSDAEIVIFYHSFPSE